MKASDGFAVCPCGRRHWRCFDRPDPRCLPCRLVASGEPLPWYWRREPGQAATQARLGGVA